MDGMYGSFQPSPVAENSRGSARPASARSARSKKETIIKVNYTVEQTTQYRYDQFPPPPNAHSVLTEVMPLSARETGTGGSTGSPPAPGREASNRSRPRSVSSQSPAPTGAPAPPAGWSELNVPSRESSKLASRSGSAASGHKNSRPSSHNGSNGGGKAGEGDGDLPTEAKPWNDLPPSRQISTINSIAPYLAGPDGAPRTTPRESSRDGAKVHSRPSSASSTARGQKSALMDVVSSGEPDLVLAGSPSISRESSHLATPVPSGYAAVPPSPPRSLPVPVLDPNAGTFVPGSLPLSAGQSRPPLEGGRSGRPPLSPSQPNHHQLGQSGSVATRNVANKPIGPQSSIGDFHKGAVFEPLPWTTQALMDFRNQMKRCSFEMLDPADNPLSARMDQVFSLPRELWPVLPPGALYCMESDDPRFSFSYLQHMDFPSTKVKVGTYFGKWGRHLVDFVVSWQPTPRHEAAWQPGGGKQPPLPWEPRQVVAHTTNGEYQYANTRIRFRGPKSTELGAAAVEWSDAHGIDLLDTKAGNEHAPRNSDKDREAHLIDPPRPNTWGEMARRPLIGNLRAKGGGAYVHHVNYDYSGLRTTCGRRVPSGYFFTLVPNSTVKTPAVPGNQSRARSASVGRSLGGAAGRSRSASMATVSHPATADPSAARLETVYSLLSSVGLPSAAAVAADSSTARLKTVYSLLSSVGLPSANVTGSGAVTTQSVQAALTGILDGSPQGSRRPTGGGSRPGSAGPPSRRSSSGSLGAPVALDSKLLPQLESVRSFGGLTGVTAATAALTTASRPPPTSSPQLFTLAPKQKWRTYDVPFHHPIHSARAQELGAAAAVAAGTGVRGFSDAAAVLQVAEQELRLQRPFVPAPIVVTTWEDVPRLYAEHMAAARALMPVTELDTYGSSKLHQLLYHLEAASTLEFDRLDAKLALLPQMARLGKRSAEIDAWLQVIIEHATYLYEKIQINDTARWPTPGSLLASEPSGLTSHPGVPPAAQASAFRRSVTFSAGAPLVAPNPHTAPAGSTASPAWAFPEPLAGTSFMEKSALNVAVQRKQPPPDKHLPVNRVTVEEWAGVTRVMDTCRHAILYDHWIRLRPMMTGFGLPSSSAYSPAGSVLGSVLGSDAGATIHSLEADPRVPQAVADPTFSHGNVNRELLDYMKEDLAAMNGPGYSPQPLGPDAFLPPTKGFHGAGPLPAEAVAEMPVPPRPARIRGLDETPLPPELESADLWNIRSKAEQSTSPDLPSDLDAGALRFSQASVGRLMAAKSFAATRQAEVRRSIQRAQGQRVWDESSVPEYGSDIAEDEPGDGEYMGTGVGTDAVPKRRSRRHVDINPPVVPLAPGTACQTAEDLDGPSPAEKILEAAAKAREAEVAAENRRRLLMGNGGKTRDQVLDEALQAAEAAIESLKPRPLGAMPLLTPPTPKGMLLDGSGEPLDAAWKPFGRGGGSQPYNPASISGEARQPQEWYNKRGVPSAAESYGKGPEPLALEKVTAVIAEPSFMSEMEAQMAADKPANKNSRPNAGFSANNVGLGGLVDYETAMARRRAIAGAELAHDKSDYLPKSEVFNLFITYCNLGGHPELVDMLERSIEAPISTATVKAKAKASAAAAAATAGYGGRHLVSPAQALLDKDDEAEQQRIRSTAWLLGVTWRRIPNETYSSFLARVLCWPVNSAMSMHRTRCTQIIAKALVRGHDLSAVPKY